MSRIPEFGQHLEIMREIHEKKNQDYASEDDPLDNFHRSAQIMEWFNDPVDKAFVSLIATKLARLAILLNSQCEPNNESVENSLMDLTIYCNLWWCEHDRRNPSED